MKVIVSIFFALVSLCWNVDAMKSPAQKSSSDQKIVNFVRYLTPTEPAVELYQFPSEKKLALGGLIATSINISCKTYNGLKVNGSLNISWDMTMQQIGEALCKFFNVGNVTLWQGTITRESLPF